MSARKKRTPAEDLAGAEKDLLYVDSVIGEYAIANTALTAEEAADLACIEADAMSRRSAAMKSLKDGKERGRRTQCGETVIGEIQRVLQLQDYTPSRQRGEIPALVRALRAGHFKKRASVINESSVRRALQRKE